LATDADKGPEAKTKGQNRNNKKKAIAFAKRRVLFSVLTINPIQGQQPKRRRNWPRIWGVRITTAWVTGIVACNFAHSHSFFCPLPDKKASLRTWRIGDASSPTSLELTNRIGTSPERRWGRPGVQWGERLRDDRAVAAATAPSIGNLLALLHGEGKGFFSAALEISACCCCYAARLVGWAALWGLPACLTLNGRACWFFFV
jgi:hypothetical protein